MSAFPKSLSPWRALALGTALAFSGGCEPEPARESSPPTDTTPTEAAEPALHPERRGIGALTLPPRGPSALAISVDPRSSLTVTDTTILTNFTFQRVMNQLVAQSGVAGLTSLRLFQEWWDTANPAPGLGLGGPHCNDSIFAGQPALNTFPYLCPRQEGVQATTNPFISPGTNADEYVPAALVNRFDLAPASGSDCGEYRIVFVKRSGMTNPGNRNLIIFEAVLPNPNPALGLNGCRPVTDLWAKLTSLPNPTDRANLLNDFYFNGLPGFMPVVHIDNYGNRTGSVATGQVRSNQFMQGPWTLREFKLRLQICSSTTPCALRFIPVTVKTNPGGTLFSPASTHPQAPAFQGPAFPAEVPTLAVNDINLFNLNVANVFNSGQSNAQGPENDYLAAFGPGPSPFHTNIQTQLTAAGSTLTPQNIVARAEALSCAGCHQLSNGANLGGGIVWPPSAGFVHVTEQLEPGPFGTRFRISPALTTTFLPHRKAVLETFLNSSCGDATCQPWETHAACSADCP
ncbi:hypothetical protein DRW03_06920 [Corallococcus sp. H22C18031201]|uniref:hypothetical protein n=1 Tax=Citreicoccus inhibens TaxID=2849499 RepID=UPI000E70DE43|nr:hypothetical protein [Citreicoccus inhibens]MBU8895283.1 hypothetical protein [Citreicoccus inhibens]RJS26177.1 hypothetical protein DRW03_06920 [Corallococcus sp. H22C18031201]